jgi:DNA-binding MarR family transcriptional regulator
MGKEKTTSTSVPTAAQLQVLQVIRRLQRKLGRSPSQRELADALGYANKSGVSQMLARLETANLVVRTRIEIVSLEFTPRGKMFLGET